MRRNRALVDRWTAWTPVLLLGALAGLTFWLDAQVQVPEAPHNGELRHDPDLFMTNFRAVSYDTAGRVKQSLTAQRAQHHPDDESVEFTSPALVITDPARPRMTVTSDAGTLSGDRETVLFRGHVVATRDAPGKDAPPDTMGAVKLSTDFLRVIPAKGLAETDRPVTIEETRGIIRGVGAILDNQTRTMRIKSGVQGSFQPDSSKQ